MKEFSTKWISSKQPGKQRKYRYNAPLHIRQKLVSAHLSPTLRERYKRRSLPLRKGDTVQIMIGKNKDQKGVVDKIDLKKLKVYIDTVKIKKVDGSEVHAPFDPSNLMVIDIKTDDKMRTRVLQRKASVKTEAISKTKETKKTTKTSKKEAKK